MKLKLIEKRDEAVGTKSFFWQPDTEVKWLAGQYYYFTLPKLNYPDPRGTTRHFSISSSPTEGSIIRFTTKVREDSGFKKTIDEMPVGSEIEGAGPNGTFILDEKDTGPHIFIAGGIGITPYRSIIKNAIDKNVNTKIYLIYSNSTPEEITFRKELEEWAKIWPNLTIALTISHPEESKEGWTGLTGRVDETLIKNLLAKWALDVKTPTWWLCGPPAMTDAMEQLVGKLGITSDKMRSEKFTGY